MSNNLTTEDKLDFLIKFVVEKATWERNNQWIFSIDAAANAMSPKGKEDLADLLGLSGDYREQFLK